MMAVNYRENPTDDTQTTDETCAPLDRDDVARHVAFHQQAISGDEGSDTQATPKLKPPKEMKPGRKVTRSVARSQSQSASNVCQ